VQKYSFSAPKNGSNAGGLKEQYAQEGRELEAVRRMATAWGSDICEPIVKADGRHDLRIHWGWFRKRRQKAVGT
jgi:hypothetical protein